MKHFGPYLIEDWKQQARQRSDVIMDILLEDDVFWNRAGVDKPKSPKALGSGSHGTAYDVGGNKVLKITDDDTEAETSSYVYKKAGIPGVIKFFGVFKKKSMPGIFFILQEKVTMSEGRAKQAYRALDTAVESVKKDQDELDFNEKREVTILTWRDAHYNTSTYEDKKIVKSILSHLSSDDAKHLAETMHRLTKAGIEFHDLHPGNIGFSGGKPVILDLGVSSSPGGKIDVFEKMMLDEIVVNAGSNNQGNIKKLVAAFEDDIRKEFGMVPSQKIKTNIHKPEESGVQSVVLRSGEFKTIHLWFSEDKIIMATIGGKRIMLKSKKADSEEIAKILYKES